MTAYGCDPENAEWYANIEAAEPHDPRPIEVGSRIAFVARFLGRRLEYVYEAKDHEPSRRLVMATTDGPLAMEATYTWTDSTSGATVMMLRTEARARAFRGCSPQR